MKTSFSPVPSAAAAPSPVAASPSVLLSALLLALWERLEPALGVDSAAAAPAVTAPSTAASVMSAAQQRRAAREEGGVGQDRRRLQQARLRTAVPATHACACPPPHQ